MHKKIWTAARGQLKNTLDEDAFERLISLIEPVSFENGHLKLAVGNDFLQLWLDPYMTEITDAVIKNTPDVRSVELTVDETVAPPVAAEAAGTEKEARRGEAAQSGGGETPRAASALDPEYTFAEFIESPSSSHAHSAAIAVAANPGRAYNPLFIYGDTGLGKTHLMQAIAHSVLAHTPRAVVRYITSEKLLNDFTEALRNRMMPEFRNHYRKVDVLLVDDIHFLTGKEETQIEFHNIYNELRNAQKQIVMTSDCSPAKIKGLDYRLVSRFQSGVVADIQSPSFETRLAILRYKQRNFTNKIPDHFLNFIAENIVSNVRQLEGALARVSSYWELTKRPLTTIDELSKLLKDMIEQERRPEPTILQIQKDVAKEYGVDVDDLTSKERPQSVALPRQIAMFLCRKLTKKSLSEIGGAFDKNHSTILHACKTIRDRMGVDPELKRCVYGLVERYGYDPVVKLGG